MTSHSPRSFVFANTIRSGDVILTSGSEKFSDQIAAATNSPYSHAILVVNRLEWFEADDDGVGFSNVLGMNGWLRSKGVSKPGVVIPKCARAEVFRHPALQTYSEDQIEKAIRNIVERIDGEDYSDFRRLQLPLEISGNPSWFTKIALKYQQWRERRSPKGMFCSEVVAHVFGELESKQAMKGAFLFDIYRGADRVHPGHLARSRLQQVPQASIREEDLPPGVSIETLGYDLDRRFDTKMARLTRTIKEGTAEASTLASQKRAEVIESINIQFSRFEHRLREGVETARVLRLENALVTFERLLCDLPKAHERTIAALNLVSAENLDFLRFPAEFKGHVTNAILELQEEGTRTGKLSSSAAENAEWRNRLENEQMKEWEALDGLIRRTQNVLKKT